MFDTPINEGGYFIMSKTNKTEHKWNIASRTIPDKATLELTNYSNFLHIKNI